MEKSCSHISVRAIRARSTQISPTPKKSAFVFQSCTMSDAFPTCENDLLHSHTCLRNQPTLTMHRNPLRSPFPCCAPQSPRLRPPGRVGTRSAAALYVPLFTVPLVSCSLKISLCSLGVHTYTHQPCPASLWRGLRMRSRQQQLPHAIAEGVQEGADGLFLSLRSRFAQKIKRSHARGQPTRQLKHHHREHGRGDLAHEYIKKRSPQVHAFQHNSWEAGIFGRDGVTT